MLTEKEEMCLLLGTSGVGKTLLMKRFEALNGMKYGNDAVFDETPSTIPTVGTNLVTLSLRRHELTVRELGGTMGPIWKNYFKDNSAVMFMIDISNRLQVAAACVQLLNVLSHESLLHTPVLVIYNKIDLPQTLSKSELESLFRLEDIVSNATQNIHQLSISACTGQGLNEVIRWLEQNTK